MSKTYFFDIDGTLSVPMYEFNVEGKNYKRCCMPANKWDSFASNNKQAYERCKVLPQINEMLKDLSEKGATLIVLSVEKLKLVRIAKDEFIRCNFENIFSKVVYVDEASEKVDYIQKYASENNIPLNDCVLVEDTFSTLMEAEEVGIIPIHITNVVYDYSKDEENDEEMCYD